MSSKRILIVDDNEYILALLEAFFQRSAPHCQTVTTNKASTALSELLLQSFDLLLSDYHMPEMNGLELAQHARHLTPEIKIVLMTSDCSCELRDKVRTLDLNGFIAKPFTMRQLKQTFQQTGILV